jgi:hypothetical protein
MLGGYHRQRTGDREMTEHLVVPERSMIEAALRSEDLEEWLRL